MNIVEALQRSKETGESFSRGSGWISYVSDHEYHLSAEELMADDWMPTKEFVDKFMSGMWKLAGEQS